MSKKLTIKRVGTLIPTLCLLVFLLVCAVLTWLATAGFPRFVIDKIESMAAAEGVPLRIDSVKLNIFKHSGLAAEGVRVYARPTDEKPIITADCVTAGFSPLKLFIGEFEPRNISLRNGKIVIPVSDTVDYHELAASNININAAFRKNLLYISTSELKLQGIPIHIKGLLDTKHLLTGESAEEEHEKLVIPALIKACQSIVDRTYHLIEEQHWTPEQYPELHLTFNATDSVGLQVQARAPKYDIDQFHFRDSQIDFDYKGDRFIINNLEFNTIQPASHVQLKGGYELETRKLTLTLESDAALLEMAKALTEGELRAQLDKFNHKPENNPHIKLNLRAEFGDNFSLNHARIDGEISQHKLRVGESVIEQLFLSFFYHDGNFNVDNLTLKFPDGSIKMTALSNNGTGKAELHADLPIMRTISLANEFLPTPVILPAGLQLGNSLILEAKAELAMPHFESGSSFEQQFIPEMNHFQAVLQLEKMAFAGITLAEPRLAISAGKREGETRSLLNQAQSITLSLQAATAEWQQNEHTPLCLTGPALQIQADDFQYDAESGSLELAASELTFNCTGAEWNGLRTEQLALTAVLNRFVHNNETSGINNANCRVSIQNFVKDDFKIESLRLTAEATSDETALLPHTIANVLLNAELNGAFMQSQKLGDLTASLHIPKNQQGQFRLQVLPESGDNETAAHVSAATQIENEHCIRLSNISAHLPCKHFAHLAEVFQISTQEFELPHNISIEGGLCLNMEAGTLQDADLRIDIPHLVRTPHRIKAFDGEKITVDLRAELQAQAADKGNLNYTGDLRVTHAGGILNAAISGNTGSHLCVKGNNTIRPDVVDRLLDYSDAHEILRDFRFNDQSKAAINNIDVAVRYDNGTDVTVDCDIVLDAIQYQQSAFTEDEQGNETLDKALKKLPFSSVVKAASHLRADYREDIMIKGVKQPTVSTITLSDVTLIYDNKPWLNLQDFTSLGLSKRGPGVKSHKTSSLKGDKVIIDIEKGYVSLTEVKGSVYAAYSLGMFYADLREHLSILLTPYPTDINTEYCQFPIYSDSKEDMKGHIRVESKKLTALDFLGTQIPLTQFTGFVGLHNDYIYLDRMNALCWDGSLNAAVKIGITDKMPAFDGQVKAQNLDLKKIAAAYKTDMDSALCEAEIRFRSKSADINDIRAYGSARIVNGNLMALSIFQPIGAFVSDITGNIKELDESAKQHRTDNLLTRLTKSTGTTINAIGTHLDRTAQYIPGYNHVFAYDIQNAFTKFTINKGHFRTDNFKAMGYNLKVTGLLDINLNNMKIYGNMWPQISSLPTLLLSPITFLSDFMLDIVIYGKVDDIKWEFRLDPRVSNNSPKTADSAKDAECPDAPKKKSKNR